LTPTAARGAPWPGDPFAFFDVIYCINLDSRPDRWQASLKEFAAIGIADRVERLSAIRHADGAEGCRLSHIECVKRGAAAGAETVLIFEDDVTFPGFSSERLARSLDRLGTVPDWELFYLGGLIQTEPRERYEHLLAAPVVQTHAYAIHRRGFDAVVQRSTAPFDLWCAGTLKSYFAYPILAWQRDGDSDIARAWTSRAIDARRAYDLLVAAPMHLGRTALLGVRSKLGRRLLRARLKRRLGRHLIRAAALVGVRLRFDGGRPRIDRV
jgi:hypothetical protein